MRAREAKDEPRETKETKETRNQEQEDKNKGYIYCINALRHYCWYACYQSCNWGCW